MASKDLVLMIWFLCFQLQNKHTSYAVGISYSCAYDNAGGLTMNKQEKKKKKVSFMHKR